MATYATVIYLFFLFLLLFIVIKSRADEDLQLLRSKKNTDLNLLQSKMNTDLNLIQSKMNTDLNLLRYQMDEDLKLLRPRTDQNMQQTHKKIEVLQRNAKILDDWYLNGFCTLANGDCPAGFTRHSNWVRTIKLWDVSSNNIKTGHFGDSSTYVHLAHSQVADLESNHNAKHQQSTYELVAKIPCVNEITRNQINMP